MKSSGFVRDPFSRALALSLVLHILLLFFLDRYEPRRRAVELQEVHAVEVGLVTLENREAVPPADIAPVEPAEQNTPDEPSVQPPPENAAPAEAEPVETATEKVPETDDTSAVLPPEEPAAPVSEEAGSADAGPAEAGPAEAVPAEPAVETSPASFSPHYETDIKPDARESAGPPGVTGKSLDDMDLSGARTPAPAYPSMAKQMEWEGDVTISFTINRKGRAEDIVIDRSSGHEVLDRAVVTTVKKRWRFPRRDDSLRVWKTFSFRLL